VSTNWDLDFVFCFSLRTLEPEVAVEFGGDLGDLGRRRLGLFLDDPFEVKVFHERFGGFILPDDGTQANESTEEVLFVFVVLKE